MKPVKILHPDAADTGSAPITPKKQNKKSYDPHAMGDFVSVSKKVNEKWAATPAITLLWITQPEFEKQVNSLSALVSQQASDSSLSPSESQSLQQMDTDMNKKVKDVKRGIDYKFGNAGVAQYARYGLVKQGGSYQLPRDRDDRLKNLPLMIAAIAADGFDKEDWGTGFWTNLLPAYTDAVKASGNTKGSVSVGSGNINAIMQQINKVSTAVRFVLRGNYPDTYQQVYRDWGWQRESY